MPNETPERGPEEMIPRYEVGRLQGLTLMRRDMGKVCLPMHVRGLESALTEARGRVEAALAYIDACGQRKQSANTEHDLKMAKRHLQDALSQPPSPKPE